MTFVDRKWRVIESLRKQLHGELRSWCIPLLKHKNWELLYFLSAKIRFLEKGIICRGKSDRGELINIWSQVFLITRKAKSTNGWSRYSGMNQIKIDIGSTSNIKLHAYLDLQALCYLNLLEVKYSHIWLFIFCSQNSQIVIFTISRS